MFHVNKTQDVEPKAGRVRTAPLLIQYTNEAKTELSRLDHETSSVVQERLDTVSAGDPHAHGVTDPVLGHRDRRLIRIGDLTVTIWLSLEVKILTVMRIQHGGGPVQWPSPPPAAPVGLLPSPFDPPIVRGDRAEDTAVRTAENAI